MRSRRAALWILVVSPLLLGKVALGQTKRSHEQYKCDDPGDMKGERLIRTINYARCLKPPGTTVDGTTDVWREDKDICHVCKCEIAEYWEIAKYCFGEDASYQFRVEADKVRYERLWREYCMPSDVDEDYYSTPTYTTDPNDKFWCADAPRVATSSGSAALFIAPLYAWWYFNRV